MEDLNHNTESTRRAFLETGITAAAGIALGLAAGQILPVGQQDAAETVKMMTADGRLVEVEKRHLMPMCGKPKPVSNQELLEWMQQS